MPRTNVSEITDIVHGFLLGACTISRLARVSVLVVLFLFLRLLTSIRLESYSQPSCYVWILLRSTISLFVIFALNIFYQTELFLNLGLKFDSPRAKKRARYALHGVTQAINLANLIQYVISTRHFFICLVMNLRLVLSKSTFTSMSQVARLFRITTISTVFLCSWIIGIHLVSLYYEWQDWMIAMRVKSKQAMMSGTSGRSPATSEFTTPTLGRAPMGTLGKDPTRAARSATNGKIAATAAGTISRPSTGVLSAGGRTVNSGSTSSPTVPATGDITDVFHGFLLGATCAYFVWMVLNRHTYLKSRLGKLSILVTVLVALRLLSSIRLESSSPSACYFWILLRSTISLFGIFSANIFFQTEMFINLAIKAESHTAKMRWRYLLHGITQLINVANIIQYLTIMSAFTNAKGFCALDERDVVPLTILTIVSFGICLIMNVAIMLSNSTFLTMSKSNYSTAGRSTTQNHRASVVSGKGGQSENGSNSSASPIKSSAMVTSPSQKNFAQQPE
ncbi:hypothetical protein H9P43_009820 [Blastocladiella emersonii ATCC 22665]|nr:hypothetical protein H9P43_009820 [Blastocladiella emersonii ATCC 22665]